MIAGTVPALALAGFGVLALGGYFAADPFAFAWPDRRAPHYPLVVVYWSDDMGMRLGAGRAIVGRLRGHGIPVLSVSSPALFGRPRDRAFVDGVVARSLELARARSGADRIAVIGSAFGADVVSSGLGRVAPRLRRRIASVVLIGPGTRVYFHANPSGLFYRGPAAADPRHTVPLLRGLPVTCIFDTRESDSLCRDRAMAHARRLGIDDGGRAAAVEAAVRRPPAPMR